MSYRIYADSACDIPEETLKSWGVKYVQLSVLFTEKGDEYRNFEIEPKEIYNRMRKGEVAQTSAANSMAFREAFEQELKAGEDIFYLGFSSGLSSTVQTAATVAGELMEEYPERKVVVVDSLAASAGYGLLLYLVCKKAEEDVSIVELTEYAKERIPHMDHWFTVDDLQYLKRGGRISPAAAFVAGALNIKPVLHVDDEGHLISMAKVRGRKASIKAMVDKYDALAEHPSIGPVFVSHGDCEEDARYLESLLMERHGIGLDRLVYVGPVIGAHSGPGTLALFFEGIHK